MGTHLQYFYLSKTSKKIIIHEEHEESYKDERSPYFDTLTVAEKLTQLNSAQLKIIDSSPKVTTYYDHQKQIIIPKQKAQPNTKIVSLKDERKIGNKSPISDLLETYLKAAGKKDKSVLLFLNKKKDSGYLYCRSCKHTQYASTPPEICPNCNSSDLWFNSLNITSLKNLVEQIIPNAKNIEIATSSILYSLLAKKFDLVAHIAADSTLNVPDFASAQRTYNLITSLKKITKGLLLIQTNNPDNTTISAALSGNYSKFFNSSLKEKKELSYPPFSLLIKLTIKGKDEEKLEQKAQDLFDELDEIEEDDVSVFGPYKPIYADKFKKYNIILKIALKNYSLKKREGALKNMQTYLKNVPKDWQITVEPTSLN